MDFYDSIYYSLIGEIEPYAALPWVPNAFAPGEFCDQAYSRLLEARNRILEKLDTDEDTDLCLMLAEMSAIQHTLCRRIMELRQL